MGDSFSWGESIGDTLDGGCYGAADVATASIEFMGG